MVEAKMVLKYRFVIWLIIGNDVRNDSGNGPVEGIDKIMVSPIEPFKCCYQFGPLISLTTSLII